MAGGVFVNDGTIELHGGNGWNVYATPWPIWATLDIGSGAMVTGSGQIVLQNAACVSAQIVGAAGAVLTLGADQTLHGYGQIGMDVVNQGQIEGDVNGGTLTFLQSLANTGTVSTVGGGNLSLSGALTNSGAVAATGSGNLTVSGQTVNTGTLEASSGATLSLNGGLTDTGTLQQSDGATLNLGGTVSTPAVLSAIAGSVLRFTNATLDNTGRTITADGGTVEIASSTINGGSLRATDNAASFVQFSGDVTLNGVPWEDDGAGVFRVYKTTARLLGDYADHLPVGYTLVVETGGAWGGGATEFGRWRLCQ